jgi:putative transposase
MQWMMTAHVRRYHSHYGSSGHIWQGRFKAFLIQEDLHLLTVLRYVERNPLRAGLVARAENWLWSSLHRRQAGPCELLHESPVPLPPDWVELANELQTSAELDGIRHCVIRGTPYGSDNWVRRQVKRCALESTVRPLGRPRRA